MRDWGTYLKKPIKKLAKARELSVANSVFSTSKSVSDFWDLAHRQKSIRWITGSTPEDELRNVSFDDVKDAIKKILIVGVGTGNTINHLSRAGYEVEALDISKESFESLDQGIKTYLTSEYQDIPRSEFDLVIHHLVAQHMEEFALIEQMKVLFESIRPGGELRFQFASSLISKNNDMPATTETCKSGSVLRSKKKISYLGSILTSNFEIRHIQNFPEWEEGWAWYLLIVRK